MLALRESETSNKHSGSGEFSARQLYFGAARPNVKLMNGVDALPADVRNKHNTGTAVQYVGVKQDVKLEVSKNVITSICFYLVAHKYQFC